MKRDLSGLCRKENSWWQEETQGRDGHVSILDGGGFTEDTLIPVLTELYAVTMEHCLHVRHTSIKQFQGKKKTQALESDLSSACSL